MSKLLDLCVTFLMLHEQEERRKEQYARRKRRAEGIH